MKKCALILLFVFSITLISAIQFDMNSEFDQGETLLAKVSGNFVEPILKENIKFFRGHVRISLDADVTKINDEFYIYASLLGKTQNDYSIVIENVKYMQGAEIIDKDIVKNFSITNNTADFSITPGFISTNQDTNIEVQNLQDSEIIINIEIENSSEGENITLNRDSLTLKSGEIEKVLVNVGSLEEPTFRIIKFKTANLEYEISVYAFSKKEIEEPKQTSFKFEPFESDVKMATNSETERIIYFYNTGETILDNVTFTISDSLAPYLSLLIEETQDIDSDSNVEIKLLLTSDSDEKSVSGQIKAKAEEEYAYSVVYLDFIKDYIPIDGEDEIIIITSTKTCEEESGTICEQDQECDGETIYAKDDKCCLGTCGERQSTTSTGKIIGWGIIIVVIVFLAWFFGKKMRKK
ncbi:MAG: hypothetical protein ABIA78_02870 [archaeon]